MVHYSSEHSSKKEGQTVKGNQEKLTQKVHQQLTFVVYC